MVIVLVPIVALLVAVKVTVTEHVGLQGLPLKFPVTPVGRPDAENVIDAELPWTRVAVIEEDELVAP